MNFSSLCHAHSDDFSSIADRGSSHQLHERRRGKDEIVEVLRLCSLPYHGSPSERIARLDGEANNLSSVINGVAAAGNGRYRPGEGAAV